MRKRKLTVKRKKKVSACGCPPGIGSTGAIGHVGFSGCPTGNATVLLTDISVTWEQLCAMESGTTICEWTEDGVRCLIKRGPNSLCAYFGVPAGHPLSNIGYDDLPLRVHGGLTFSQAGDGKYFPVNHYWFGWDYCHAGDYVFYYDDPRSTKFNHCGDHKWLLSEVQQEVKWAVYDFKKLMELAEKSAKHLWIDMSELKSESENESEKS